MQNFNVRDHERIMAEDIVEKYGRNIFSDSDDSRIRLRRAIEELYRKDENIKNMLLEAADSGVFSNMLDAFGDTDENTRKKQITKIAKDFMNAQFEEFDKRENDRSSEKKDFANTLKSTTRNQKSTRRNLPANKIELQRCVNTAVNCITYALGELFLLPALYFPSDNSSKTTKITAQNLNENSAEDIELFEDNEDYSESYEQIKEDVRRILEREPLFDGYSLDDKARPLISPGFGPVYTIIKNKDNLESSLKVLHIIGKDRGKIAEELKHEIEIHERHFKKKTIKDIQDIKEIIKIIEKRTIINIEKYLLTDDKKYLLIQIEYLPEIGTNFNELYESEKLDPANRENEVIKMGIAICAALEGIPKDAEIRKNINPAYIFKHRYGGYKLGLFGETKSIENGFKIRENAYISPEKYAGKAIPGDDPRQDIYSLGLFMYELLNDNQLPFANGFTDEKDIKKAVDKRLKGETLPVYPLERYSKFLKDIVLKACKYNPEERYGSVEEMRKALEAIIEPSLLTKTKAELDEDTAEIKKHIDIPHTYKAIGDMAFIRRKNLESININSSVEIIGAGAFGGCRYLKNVNMGNGTDINIGSFAFWGCEKLESVTISRNVKRIGNWAFRGCKNLTRVFFHGGAYDFGDDIFRECNKKLTVYCSKNSFADVDKYCKEYGIRVERI